MSWWGDISAIRYNTDALERLAIARNQHLADILINGQQQLVQLMAIRDDLDTIKTSSAMTNALLQKIVDILEPPEPPPGAPVGIVAEPGPPTPRKEGDK